MLRSDLLGWSILVLLFAACNRGEYQESTPLPTETAFTHLEDEYIQNQSEGNSFDNTTVTPDVIPCAEDKLLYDQTPAGLPGTLVYRLIQDTNKIHLIGGRPLRQHTFEVDDQHTLRLIGFSPGGEWLAYLTGSPYEGIPQTIHLLSSSGQTVQTTPLELVPTEAGTFKGSWKSIFWVNDETMLLYIAQQDPEYPDTSPLMIKAF